MATPKKLEILRKRAEFLAVAASGKKWVAPGFILQIGEPKLPLPIPVDGLSPIIRYGLTASGKVGNAVIRNRARRRMRALAQEILINASSEHDYVMVARPTTHDFDFDAMRQDLIKGMKRMKVWAAD